MNLEFFSVNCLYIFPSWTTRIPLQFYAFFLSKLNIHSPPPLRWLFNQLFIYSLLKQKTMFLDVDSTFFWTLWTSNKCQYNVVCLLGSKIDIPSRGLLWWFFFLIWKSSISFLHIILCIQIFDKNNKYYIETTLTYHRRMIVKFLSFSHWKKKNKKCEINNL